MWSQSFKKTGMLFSRTYSSIVIRFLSLAREKLCLFRLKMHVPMDSTIILYMHCVKIHMDQEQNGLPSAVSPDFLSRHYITIFGGTVKWDRTQELNVIRSYSLNSPIILWARRAWKCAIQCPCYLKLEAPMSNKEESHVTALSADFQDKKGSPCCLD